MSRDAFPKNLDNAPTVGEQHLDPMTLSHLRKVDSAKQQSREQEDGPLFVWAICDSLQGRRNGSRIVGTGPGFADLAFGLFDAHMLWGERHMKWTEVEPVLRARETFFLKQPVVEWSCGIWSKQTKNRKPRRPGFDGVAGPRCDARLIPIHAEDE